MPGPTDDYFVYKRWFEAGHDALTFPLDCTELDLVLRYSNLYTWDVEWVLIFANPQSYIRITENFAKRAGLDFSRRINFAYHYGPTIKKNLQGNPEPNPADAVFVRIDNAGRPVHLHHESNPTDHIPQSRVTGLLLDSVDLFDFVRAAFRHRRSGNIANELGYRIT